MCSVQRVANVHFKWVHCDIVKLSYKKCIKSFIKRFVNSSFHISIHNCILGLLLLLKSLVFLHYPCVSHNWARRLIVTHFHVCPGSFCSVVFVINHSGVQPATQKKNLRSAAAMLSILAHGPLTGKLQSNLHKSHIMKMKLQILMPIAGTGWERNKHLIKSMTPCHTLKCWGSTWD